VSATAFNCFNGARTDATTLPAGTSTKCGAWAGLTIWTYLYKTDTDAKTRHGTWAAEQSVCLCLHPTFSPQNGLLWTLDKNLEALAKRFSVAFKAAIH
jgi:hypothetical protein